MSNQLKKIYRKGKQIVSNDKGQGLVEYALILVLIAVVVMGAVQSVGKSTNSTFTRVNSGLTVNP